MMGRFIHAALLRLAKKPRPGSDVPSVTTPQYSSLQFLASKVAVEVQDCAFPVSNSSGLTSYSLINYADGINIVLHSPRLDSKIRMILRSLKSNDILAGTRVIIVYSYSSSFSPFTVAVPYCWFII